MTAGHYVTPPLEVTIERAYQDRIRPLIGPGYGLNLIFVVVYNGEGRYDDRFGDMVNYALKRGIITSEEREEIWNFRTTVFVGQSLKDESAAFGVVDVALEINHSHVDRVVARAAILRRIIQEPVIPAIVGAFISDDSVRQLAEQRGVSLFPRSLDDAKMYRYFRQDVLEDLYAGKIEL